jgi:hypothetical protein
MNNLNQVNRTCPSLGLKDDAGSSLAFPSNWNYCHRSRPIASVRLKHQEEFCLGGKYQECPVFLSQHTVPLPEHIRAPRRRVKRFGYNSCRNLVIALIVVIAVLTLGWGIMSQRFLPLAIWRAPQTASASAVSVTTATSVLTTMTRTVTLSVPSSGSVTITGTPTSAVTLTRTPTPTSSLIKHRLDIPIGTDYKFVIHRVSEGEKLEQYAAKYNTSVDAIVAVNFNLRNPVWTDVLVVIPVGFTDVAGLPIFVVYQVKEEERGISIEALANKLRVDPLDLKYYNGMTEAWDRPLVGDLFLVPWPRPAPP